MSIDIPEKVINIQKYEYICSFPLRRIKQIEGIVYSVYRMVTKSVP